MVLLDKNEVQVKTLPSNEFAGRETVWKKSDLKFNL